MPRLSARSVKRQIQIDQVWRSRVGHQVIVVRQVYRHEGTALVTIWRDDELPVPQNARRTFMELGRDYRLVLLANGERADGSPVARA